MVGAGTIISGGHVERSVLSPEVRIQRGSRVSGSVVMTNVRIGEHTEIHNAILDKNVVVEDGATVGVDLAHDRERGYTVTESGITVVGKGIRIVR